MGTLSIVSNYHSWISEVDSYFVKRVTDYEMVLLMVKEEERRLQCIEIAAKTKFTNDKKCEIGWITASTNSHETVSIKSCQIVSNYR